MRPSVPAWSRLFRSLTDGWPTQRKHKVLWEITAAVAKELDVATNESDYRPLWEADLHELGHLLTFPHPRDFEDFKNEVRPRSRPSIGAYISHMSRKGQAVNEADALAFETELSELFGLTLPFRVIRDGYNNADAGSTLNVTFEGWSELVQKRRNSRLVRRALKNAFPRFAAAYERLQKERHEPPREPVAPPDGGTQGPAG